MGWDMLIRPRSGMLTSVQSETIGYQGAGNFAQSGGTHTISGTGLVVGHATTATGSYTLSGGTLVVSDDQVTGPGVAALELPGVGPAAEDTLIRWGPDGRTVPAQRYRYRPITGGSALATADSVYFANLGGNGNCTS